MYKLVATTEDELTFNRIWTEAWIEKGFELEFSEKVLGQCLVHDARETAVATVELKPYCLKSSGLNELAPFAQHPLLQQDKNHIAEVDKVALHKQHRGKNLDRVLATIVLFAEKNKIRQYVTLLDPLLYRALRISFHVPMSRVGERIYYKGADVIPTIIHAAEFYENKEKFDWYIEVLNERLSLSTAHT